MNTKDSQGKAAARMMMIAPILDESLDQRSIIELKKKLAEQHAFLTAPSAGTMKRTCRRVLTG